MNWPRKRLGELGVVSTGSTPRTSEPQFYGGDIPFVTPAELDTASPVITTPRTLTAEGAAEARVLPEGAVMVCCIGSLGKTGIAVYNNRGVSTRGMYDGGAQERTLAKRYDEMSKALSAKWPRTAAMLGAIAKSYHRDAQHEDVSTDLRDLSWG